MFTRRVLEISSRLAACRPSSPPAPGGRCSCCWSATWWPKPCSVNPGPDIAWTSGWRTPTPLGPAPDESERVDRRGSSRVASGSSSCTLVSAISALGIPALTVHEPGLAYLPNVIAALAIFAVAGLVAGAVRTIKPPRARSGGWRPPWTGAGDVDRPFSSPSCGSPRPLLVTYSAVGALALGSALAFGLGGGRSPRTCCGAA